MEPRTRSIFFCDEDGPAEKVLGRNLYYIRFKHSQSIITGRLIENEDDYYVLMSGDSKTFEDGPSRHGFGDASSTRFRDRDPCTKFSILNNMSCADRAYVCVGFHDDFMEPLDYSRLRGVGGSYQPWHNFCSKSNLERQCNGPNDGKRPGEKETPQSHGRPAPQV